MTGPISLEPSKQLVYTTAAIFTFSGVSQPLLTSLCEFAGLTSSSAQFLMVFYYLGPALFLFRCENNSSSNTTPTPTPSVWAYAKCAFISTIDLTAQAMNYTGAAMAGATIFAIVYSSVTVWAAVYSRIFLHRVMTWWQWTAVVLVFGGLMISAADSVSSANAVGGAQAIRGTLIIIVGASLHGGVYVMYEGVMRGGGDHSLNWKQNATTQSLVALTYLTAWQLIYTFPHWDEVMGEPMRTAGTTWFTATLLLASFALASFLHTLSYFYTLRYFPAGATSAGVMKGLQAVLVFVAADIIFCRPVSSDGVISLASQEMCFSSAKFYSLITVVFGVTLFGLSTEYHDPLVFLTRKRTKLGYTHVGDGNTPHRSDDSTPGIHLESV